MTTTTAGHSPTTRAAGVLRPAGLAILLGVIFTAIMLARDTNGGPAWRVSLVLVTAVLAATALVFGLVVRLVLRRNSARASGLTALILGAVTVLSLVVFWLAVPPVFGVAALALTRDARDRRPSRGQALAAIGAVLAGLGMLAAFAIAAAE